MLLLTPQSLSITVPANSNSKLFLISSKSLKSSTKLCHPCLMPATYHRRKRKNLVVSAASVIESAGDTFTKYSGYLFQLSSSEADSIAEYDVSKIASIYQRKPLIVLRRLFQISTTLGKWFGMRYLDSVFERSDQMFKITGYMTLLLSLICSSELHNLG